MTTTHSTQDGKAKRGKLLNPGICLRNLEFRMVNLGRREIGDLFRD